MFRGNVITLHRASCDAGFELLGVNVTSRVGDVADLLRVSWFVSSVVVKCGGSEPLAVWRDAARSAACTEKLSCEVKVDQRSRTCRRYCIRMVFIC